MRPLHHLEDRQSVKLQRHRFASFSHRHISGIQGKYICARFFFTLNVGGNIRHAANAVFVREQIGVKVVGVQEHNRLSVMFDGGRCFLGKRPAPGNKTNNDGD